MTTFVFLLYRWNKNSHMFQTENLLMSLPEWKMCSKNLLCTVLVLESDPNIKILHLFWMYDSTCNWVILHCCLVWFLTLCHPCLHLSRVIPCKFPLLTWLQGSGSSSKLSLCQCSKSSCLSVGSCVSGLMLSAGSPVGWLWLCVSAALFCFWFCVTVLWRLSLTILHMRIPFLIVCCTSSSTSVQHILHALLLSCWSSAARSFFRLHIF